MSSRAAITATVALAFVLGAWVRSDAFGSGFWSDDYLTHAMVEGAYPSPRAAWDQFRFADGSRAEWQRLVDFGYYPWWTHPNFQLSMLRPLPSLLNVVDQAVLGFDAYASHLHSLLWWGLMLASVAALLFALLPRGAAAAAVVFFALDESHSVPLVWLSNRSLLVATAFGAAGLLSHVCWRRSGKRSLRASSIALFALALASGEYALGMFGYLLCFELGSRFEGPSRVRALAPAALLGACFLTFWIGLGYGVAHSGLYTNPLRTPLAYAEKLSVGLPVLLGELTLGVPADWWSFGSPWPAKVWALGLFNPGTWAKLPSWHLVQLGLGLLGALGVFALLAWLRGRLEREHGLCLRWLSAGAVVGLLPMLGSFVTTRLVLPSNIGFAALFGSVTAHALTRLRAGSARNLVCTLGAAALGAIIVYMHAYRALVVSKKTTELYSYAALSRTAWPMTAELDDAISAEQRVVMVAAADANDAPYLPFVRMAYHKPLLRGFRLLSGALGSHELRRVDARTLEVHVLDALGLEASVVGSLTRAPGDRLRPGERFAVAGMRVEVLELHAGQPVRMRYSFDVPLEDSSLVWLQSTPRGLKRLALPEVGKSVRLLPPSMPDLDLQQRAAATAR